MLKHNLPITQADVVQDLMNAYEQSNFAATEYKLLYKMAKSTSDMRFDTLEKAMTSLREAVRVGNILKDRITKLKKAAHNFYVGTTLGLVSMRMKHPEAEQELRNLLREKACTLSDTLDECDTNIE